MGISKNVGLSLIFVVVLSVFADARTNEFANISEIENSAKELAAQWNGESIRRSIVLYSEAAEKWTKADEPAKASRCIEEESRLRLQLGENETALLKLLELLKRNTAKNLSVEKSRTESLLSAVYLQIGKFAESKKNFELALKDANISGDKNALAMADSSAAEYFNSQNDFEKAIIFYQESVSLFKDTKNFQRQAETLVNFANIYMILGEPKYGLTLAQEANNIFNKIGNRRGIKLSQITNGHLLSAMDEKQSALAYYQQANQNFPDDLDLVEKGGLLNGLGRIYEDYDDYIMSLNYREQALQLFERGKYLQGQLATMPSLIKLNFLLKNSAKAEQYIKQAENLSVKLNDKFIAGIISTQIGDYYFENFDNDKAFNYYQKSLTISRTAGFKYNDVQVLNKLGKIYQFKGQLDSARKNYNSSLEISRQILNKFNEAEALFNLAQLDDLENKTESSLRNVEKSIEITESLTSSVSNSKLKSTYFSGVYERYELYIKLLMKQNETSPDKNFALRALQAAEKSRSRSMLETMLLANADFTKYANPETIKREKEIRSLLNIKSDKLTDLLSQKAGKDVIDKLDREINELQNELEIINAELRQKSPVYSALKNPLPFDAADFQNRVMDENSMLLEFSLGNDASYLWTISKNEINSYILPPRAEIEKQVTHLRELLASREVKNEESVEDYQARTNNTETEYRKLAHDLSDNLLGQIADKLSGKRLIIVADGRLHYFPVSALPLPNSTQDEPILLSNEVIYEPSAQTLAISFANRNSNDTAAKNLLAFTDPVFSQNDVRFPAQNKTEPNADETSTSAGSLRFVQSLSFLPRLSASKNEVDLITDNLGTSGADVYSGFLANREQFLSSKLDDYKVIHFATHGLINEERPELSGIILSRFDDNGKKIDEFIRLQDIYAANLKADLVVLSACETGIGKEVKGEGLMSLNNAFLQSGSKSVISTLWKVDDFATLELMQNFYRIMANENISPSDALRSAQIKMWENPQYKSPFYWAAFTFHGNYQSKPEFSHSGDNTKFYVLFSTLLTLALFFGGFWFYKKKRRSVN